MLELLTTYPRRIKIGDSFAVCGPLFILVVLRLDTAGADAVALWVEQQDTFALVADAAMPDGRWVGLLQRKHTLQSSSDALTEYHAFVVTHRQATFN